MDKILSTFATNESNCALETTLVLPGLLLGVLPTKFPPQCRHQNFWEQILDLAILTFKAVTTKTDDYQLAEMALHRPVRTQHTSPGTSVVNHHHDRDRQISAHHQTDYRQTSTITLLAKFIKISHGILISRLRCARNTSVP